MSDELRIDLCDGKYTYILSRDYKQKALRYGEEWRQLDGDKFVLALASELQEARDAIERLTRERDDMVVVCGSYADENQRLLDRAEAAERKVERLREALKPFARMADRLSYEGSLWRDDETHWVRCVEFDPEPTVGDLRRARAALDELENK